MVAYTELFSSFLRKNQIKLNEPMSRHTTFGIGDISKRRYRLCKWCNNICKRNRKLCRWCSKNYKWMCLTLQIRKGYSNSDSEF